jgi:carboxymethylenebutenolidase
VTTEEVVYATLDGGEVHGYLATPAEGGEGAPGILVIHEWWGLNDNVRAMARQLAGEGYQALAVDIYRGQVASERDDARTFMEEAMASPELVDDNLRQAHAFLVERGAQKTGSIGWCFGGGMSLRTALLLPEELDATVIYYGRLETDEDVLRPLAMPILGIFGADDQGIPVESVRAFEGALQNLGKDATIHIYEGADHAFANPSGTRYNEEAATDAWGKTLAFFAEHLR